MFCTESLLRLGSRLPLLTCPKVLSLKAREEVEVHPQPRDAREVRDAIGRATFTGKGDYETVLQMYFAYQNRFDRAALSTAS